MYIPRKYNYHQKIYVKYSEQYVEIEGEYKANTRQASILFGVLYGHIIDVRLVSKSWTFTYYRKRLPSFRLKWTI
jgi:hypothetical protein